VPLECGTTVRTLLRYCAVPLKLNPRQIFYLRLGDTA
jgi:hypothetical protein